MKKILLYTFIILHYALFSQSIDESRRTDWSNAGVEDGIPCIIEEFHIFNIMDYGGINDGSMDNYSAFQETLAAAENAEITPKVIYFPEGEYLINTSIRVPENTIIRGEGYQKTKLTFDLNGANSPCFDTPVWKWGNYIDVTAGATKESTLITVTDASSFVLGEWLEIEEDNNAALMYTSQDWNVSYAQYAKGQLVRVIAINGNNITIDRPLKTNYNTNQHIRARKGELAENIGFENFYITRPNTGDSYFFYLKNTANVWLKGIYGYRTNKSFVQTERAVNFEVRECYFERSYDYGGGGHGYGVSVGYHSCDGLIENNIFNRLRHHMIIAKGASGNVFGYNYSFDRVQGSDTNNLNDGWTPPDISIHGHWSYMNLFEGNISQEIHSADHWGPSGPGTTFFRNRLEAPEGVTIDDGSLDQNLVGNELSTGDFDIEASTSGTYLNGNNVQGTISWNGTNESLINSHYLNTTPSFWNTSNWPSIGPEFNINSGSNPAKNRWEAQEDLAITYSCTITGNKKSIETEKIDLYPNPFQNTFTIETDKKGTYRILTLNGLLLENGVISNTLGSSLDNGIYLIEITLDNAIYSERVVKI